MGKNTAGNKIIKEKLMKQYGKGCMFEKAKIAERIEAMGGIDTFKTFVSKKRYKGQKISKQLTLHHLKHRSEGGKTSVENGAVVSEIAHQYLHSLSRDEEEIANNMLREWKINIIAMNGNQQVIQSISFNPKETNIIIPAGDMTEEEYKKYQNLQKKRKRIANPNRAQLKKELTQLIEEEGYEI